MEVAMATVNIRRALLSVSDKTNIVALAQALADTEVELLSTGGTAAALRDAGLTVTDVSAYTGFPEMMGGRVKTLHPKVHGGILGRRGRDDAVMQEHGIAAIDLVVVNLYPFQQTVAKSDCTFQEAIENIDIGGPAMLRSAAKNHADVAVLTDPEDYAELITTLASSSGVSAAQRLRWSAKAYAHTAQYDAAIARYMQGTVQSTSASTSASISASTSASTFPQDLSLSLCKHSELRYGENPHQSAAFYQLASTEAEQRDSISQARMLQGKALSYNNIADSDAALECVRQFALPACVIVKHANPCGVATAESLQQAYQLAYRTDPTSAFGGIIAFNRTVDAKTAQCIVQQQFVEVLIAPEFAEGALTVLAEKPNVRVLCCDVDGELGLYPRTQNWHYQAVNGGMLVQQSDTGAVNAEDLRIVTQRQPDDAQVRDMLFAWKVAKFVKSNAIVYAKEQATVGVGAGQMSRIYSARIAIIKATDAGLSVPGAVMASDAFFPFRDGIDAAAEAGVSAIIQPGGSMRDEEVVAAADEHGLVMAYTGMRHFRH